MVRLLAAFIFLTAFPAVAADDSSLRRLPEQQALLLAFKAAFKTEPPATILGKSNRYDYRPQALIWLDGIAVLVSTAPAQDGCHACSGMLGIHYLRPLGSEFALLGSWLEMVELGFWGGPPQWELRTDLMENPVLEVGAGSIWQGMSRYWTGLIELTPQRPLEILKPVLARCDDSGALHYFPPPDWDGDESNTEGFTTTPEVVIEGEISPLARGQSFVLRYTGTSQLDVIYERRGLMFYPSAFQQLLVCG